MRKLAAHVRYATPGCDANAAFRPANRLIVSIATGA
jgi:hypothetical protein